jgi:hypothetical protein
MGLYDSFAPILRGGGVGVNTFRISDLNLKVKEIRQSSEDGRED